MAKTMDGPEMMNRLLGRNKEDAVKPQPVGRPPSADTSPDDLKLLLHPENPLLTNVVTHPDDDTVWLGGSIIQVASPDGGLNSYVLGHDLKVYSMWDGKNPDAYEPTEPVDPNESV